MFAYSGESKLKRCCDGARGEVVEAQAPPEVPGRSGTPDGAGQEGGEMSPHTGREQRRRPVDGGVGGVHRDLPVELVEPDRRPAPPWARGHPPDLVTDAGHRVRLEPEDLARPVGLGQALRRFAAEDLVHDRVLRPAAPARTLVARIGAGEWALGPRLRPGQEPGDRPRALIVARRPDVPMSRGDGEDQQLVGVDLRRGRAMQRVIAAGALVPAHVEVRLQTIGDRQVPRAVEREGFGAAAEPAHGQRDEGGAADREGHAPTL